MICPHCGSSHNRVVNSRDAQSGTVIRRRRECLNCGERFTTFEQIEEIPLLVIKRNGRRDPYNRQKVLNGLRTACRKRPISDETIESIAAQVERMLFARGQREVASSEIGEIVLDQLREIDQVAYIRFASVYRKFDSVDEFLKELRDLRKDQPGS